MAKIGNRQADAAEQHEQDRGPDQAVAQSAGVVLRIPCRLGLASRRYRRDARHINNHINGPCVPQTIDASSTPPALLRGVIRPPSPDWLWDIITSGVVTRARPISNRSRPGLRAKPHYSRRKA